MLYAEVLYPEHLLKKLRKNNRRELLNFVEPESACISKLSVMYRIPFSYTDCIIAYDGKFKFGHKGYKIISVAKEDRDRPPLNQAVHEFKYYYNERHLVLNARSAYYNRRRLYEYEKACLSKL